MRHLFLLMFTSFSILTMAQQLEVGDTIPLFSLQDQNGDVVHIQDKLNDGPVVIYFYPKDDTPGCTKEACSFRDSYTAFTDEGVTVIGISSDSPEDHKAFAEKYQLPFLLLSDINKEVRKAFGVKGDLFGLIPGRVTFVVDSNGVVHHVFDSQTRAEAHITESLEAIRNLNNSDN